MKKMNFEFWELKSLCYISFIFIRSDYNPQELVLLFLQVIIQFNLVWYIPPSEGGSSIVILSQTQDEEFPHEAEGVVWGLFTEGLGKNIDTTPNLGGRNDILFKHRV